MKLTRNPSGSSSYTITTYVENDKYLSYRENGDVICLANADMLPSDQNLWDLELLSGELCFVSSLVHNKRLTCGPRDDKPSLSPNWKGWEIWRFIEAGYGHVRISNWTHNGKFICSDDQGKVWTTDNHLGEWELWNVERAPNNADGVVIKSVSHHRFLAAMNDSWISTSNDFCGNVTTWQTEAANANCFYISSVRGDKRIGSSVNGVFSTKNRKGWEVWVMEREGWGAISLRSKAHGKRLGSDSKGHVYVTNEMWRESELWILERLDEKDGFLIKSAKHGRYLSHDDGNGKIATLWFGDSSPTSAMTWLLEPCIIKNFENRPFCNWRFW